MLTNLIITAVITILVAAVTGALVYWRSEQMSSSTDPAKGFEAKRAETTRFFVLVTIFVGAVSSFVYRWFLGRFPETADLAFLELAIAFGVLLTVLALLFLRKAFVEMAALHVLNVLAFGWILPRLLF
jgi:hypothetical protein